MEPRITATVVASRASAVIALALITMALPGAPAGARQGGSGGSEPPAAGESQPAAGLPQLSDLKTILDRELRKRLGPAAEWKIEVAESDEPRPAGQLPKVEIRGTNLQMPDGLVISLVQLTLDGVGINVQDGVLYRTGEATLHLRVRPDDVARLIERKSKGKLRGVRIDTSTGRFKTRGSLHFGFLSLGISRLSHPEIRGNAVYARTYSMKVAGLNVGQHMRKMEAKFNPIIDLDEIPQPLRLNHLGEDNGDLVVDATLDLAAPVRPAEVVEKWRKRQREQRGKRGRKEGAEE